MTTTGGTTGRVGHKPTADHLELEECERVRRCDGALRTAALGDFAGLGGSGGWGQCRLVVAVFVAVMRRWSVLLG